MSAPCVIPPSLKIVTSVMRRAEELDKDTANPDARIVAYYCRLYCVTKGSKIAGSDPEAGKFLIGQMDLLERIKPTLPGTKEDGHKTCLNYALTVFNKAEEEDQAGVADKTTAKIYYAAGSFFDILDQFGDVGPEIEEKRKYAKWKATDILNAIKDGRKPTIGGSADEVTRLVPLLSSTVQSFVQATSEATGAPMQDLSLAPKADYSMDIPSAPVGGPVVPIPRPPFAESPVPQFQQQQQYPQYQQQSPQYQQPYVQSPPPPAFQQPAYSAPAQPHVQLQQPPAAGGGYSRPGYVAPVTPPGPVMSNTDPRAKDVIEICAFAVAALKHNEMALAKDRLREALRRLES